MRRTSTSSSGGGIRDARWAIELPETRPGDEQRAHHERDPDHGVVGGIALVRTEGIETHLSSMADPQRPAPYARRDRPG